VKKKIYFTQWAGQFSVASELSRRGYLVGIYLGNAPESDLAVSTQDGKSFSVQVKTMTNPTNRYDILIAGLEKWEKPKENLFFVFVEVRDNEPLKHYITTSKEVLEAYKNPLPLKRKGKPRKKETSWTTTGIKFESIKNYLDRWDKLPN
jgi:uncharacterized protein (DUF1330 family)